MDFAGDVKATLAIVVAATALAGVVITAIATLLVSRRSTYLNAVTVERSKWIDKLRSNISQLISDAHTMDVKLYRDDSFHTSEQYDALSQSIVQTMALIRLQLNPDGNIDANILALMTAIQGHVGEQDYKQLERLFVRHVQWLSKEEWEKVKFEARSWWGRLFALYEAHRRKAAYRQFCATAGSVASWVSKESGARYLLMPDENVEE